MIFLACPDTLHSQTGGRKKERTARRRGNFRLNTAASMGHADEFARGSSGRRGRLARLFRKPRPSWVYKSSGSRRSHFRANRFLLTRHRSEGVKENAEYHYRSNRERARNRDHGNNTFKRRKYRR